jgi:enoyl-CoA hydratase/carnithine racemase
LPEYETILVREENRVGWSTLNRPGALNALNATLMGELVGASKAFDADPETGAIVITGSERAFAAGADITQMADKGYADPEARAGLFAPLGPGAHCAKRSGMHTQTKAFRTVTDIASPNGYIADARRLPRGVRRVR